MTAILLVLTLSQVTDPVVATIAKGTYSGVSGAKQVVIRTQAEWTALWKSHASPQAAPAADFRKQALVAVFLGTRPTGGFSVEITGTRRNRGTLTVEYVERRPDPADIVTQAVTTPFHIVAIPRHGGPVRFQRRPAAGSPR